MTDNPEAKGQPEQLAQTIPEPEGLGSLKYYLPSNLTKVQVAKLKAHPYLSSFIFKLRPSTNPDLLINEHGITAIGRLAGTNFVSERIARAFPNESISVLSPGGSVSRELHSYTQVYRERQIPLDAQDPVDPTLKLGLVTKAVILNPPLSVMDDYHDLVQTIPLLERYVTAYNLLDLRRDTLMKYLQKPELTTVARFDHTIYYFSPADVVRALLTTSSRSGFGFLHPFQRLIANPLADCKGVMPFDEGNWSYNGVTRQITCQFGNEMPFHHDCPFWLNKKCHEVVLGGRTFYLRVGLIHSNECWFMDFYYFHVVNAKPADFSETIPMLKLEDTGPKDIKFDDAIILPVWNSIKGKKHTPELLSAIIDTLTAGEKCPPELIDKYANKIFCKPCASFTEASEISNASRRSLEDADAMLPRSAIDNLILVWQRRLSSIPNAIFSSFMDLSTLRTMTKWLFILVAFMYTFWSYFSPVFYALGIPVNFIELLFGVNRPFTFYYLIGAPIIEETIKSIVPGSRFLIGWMETNFDNGLSSFLVSWLHIAFHIVTPIMPLHYAILVHIFLNITGFFGGIVIYVFTITFFLILAVVDRQHHPDLLRTATVQTCIKIFESFAVLFMLGLFLLLIGYLHRRPATPLTTSLANSALTHDMLSNASIEASYLVDLLETQCPLTVSDSMRALLSSQQLLTQLQSMELAKDFCFEIVKVTRESLNLGEMLCYVFFEIILPGFRSAELVFH